MKKLIKILGSMKTMATLMLIFAISIGYATFIENDYGTMTAKAEVYNARWFEILLLLLSTNLLINILNFKMYRKEKALVLTFHISFFVILIGAAITRYGGYEGSMHIRQGETSNYIISDRSYIKAQIDDKSYEKAILLSKLSKNNYSFSSSNVDVELKKYIPNATYKYVEDEKGEPVLNFMVTTSDGAKKIYLSEGESFEADSLVLNFNSKKSFTKPVIDIFLKNDELFMKNPMKFNTLNMDSKMQGIVNESNNSKLNRRTLYQEGKTNFVLKDFISHAKKVLYSVENKEMAKRYDDALIFEVSKNQESKEITVFGRKGVNGEIFHASIDGSNVDISYGSKKIIIPFSIKLVKFDMSRYPGSNSPSSYASDVVLIDNEKGINVPFRIYMNHVLDHRNYRFFQSSYDQDEKGTVLSVNHDPGTLPTYIGYILLGIGLFGSLFMKNGRFSKLSQIAKKASKEKASLALIALFLALFTTTPLKAENQVIKDVKAFNKEHANKFGKLLVQDNSGRMKPLDTLAIEVVNKLHRSDSFLGLNANQIMLGMMLKPESWREINFIYSRNKNVNKLLGVKEGSKYVAFSKFFKYPSQMTGYMIGEAVEEAIRKAPKDRNKFDKAILKVDERVNIAYLVYTGSLLKIWPNKEDKANAWYDTVKALETLPKNVSNEIRQIAISYFGSVDEALKTNDWSKANAQLDVLDKYQRENGAKVYLDQNRIDLEIFYNHAHIFEILWPLYFLVGFLLLFLSFFKILNPSFNLDIFTKGTFAVLVLFFMAHTLGLGIRWYISGHAPWSNGYESMIYIAWASVLAGFIFSKNSHITMAATGILTGLILFVAHLNWMDPQVTNLVPVLQSYWLSIHVSMITASYGFLALGALLGFLTLMLFIFQTKKNTKSINLSIKELSAINEMTLIIGLSMLTLGNFLGGVWANESWGRYWGWDPKETWALVSILVYAVVIHLRFIKSIYSNFSFAVISLMSFSVILMTYFGVNYYLAGMHSYAKGDTIPIPGFVPLTYTIVFAVIAFAYYRKEQYKV